MTESTTYSFYLPKIIGERLQIAAARERRSASNYLTRLLEQELTPLPACPACAGPTFKKDDAVYCEECGAKVAVA